MIHIANRTISPAHSPLVIADMGINHGGSLALAKSIVLSASQSGCEMIKHQTHFIEDEMTVEAKHIFPPNADVSIWDVMARCALSKDDEIELKNYTESLGMIYISTPFSRAAADFLNEIGVPAFKIGSGECNHLPLIRHIAGFGKPIIMSTGMQTIDSLRPAVQILIDSKVPFALLECTNLYPSPPEIVSLQGVLDLKTAFPEAIIGFSDHSIGSDMALASVALGACILERHYTDNRYRKGPDIICSMDPVELKYLINRSREIHIALHNPKQRTAPEEGVYQFARASIVADTQLKAGDTITKHNIWARRPGTGEISVEHFDQLMGAKVLRDLHKNQQLLWSDIALHTRV